MDIAQIENALWWFNIPLLGTLSLRLLWNGMALRYRYLFFLVTFMACRLFLLELVKSDTKLFFHVWIITEPFLVLAYTLAVFEIYGMALHRYQGLKTVSKRVLTFAIVIASLISVLSIFPDIQFNASLENQTFLLVNVVRRGVYTSLLVCLVLLLSFITIFPVRLSRNTIVHAIVFSVTFLFFTVSLLTANLGGIDSVPLINLGAALTAALASITWALFLTPAGESVESAMPNRLTAKQADALLEKLRAINDSLADTGKRL